MNIMMVLVSIALLATIAVFFAGNISMALGGKYDDNHSEEYMQSRLVLHAITILLILLAVLAW